MSRSGRVGRVEIVDIDSSILLRTGRRVRNREKVKNTKMDDLQAKAIECLSDVEDHFDFYNLAEINDAIELQDYLSKAEGIKRDFRRVHAQLKNIEGEDVFNNKYTYYEQSITDLNTALRNGSKKLITLRNNPGGKLDQKPLVDVQIERDRAKLKSDRGFFLQQAEWELKELVWDELSDVSDIKSGIIKFENRLESFFKICSNFGFNFTEVEMDNLGFKDEDDELIEKFKDKIRAGKQRLISVKIENGKIDQEKLDEQERLRNVAEEDRVSKEKIAEEKRVRDLINCAKNLHFEIKTRYTMFSGKCNVNISDLNDFEILSLKKREEDLHVELRELIDKVSGFEKFVLPC